MSISAVVAAGGEDDIVISIVEENRNQKDEDVAVLAETKLPAEVIVSNASRLVTVPDCEPETRSAELSPVVH